MSECVLSACVEFRFHPPGDRYRECKLRGRCKTKCTFVRRIWDDDDGVTVDVVQQGDKLVAYKSYHLCHDELFHQRILDEVGKIRNGIVNSRCVS